MKNFIKRIIVCAIFLIATILIINNAPQYELEHKYKDGDIRLILNDTEITRDVKKLPERVALLNGEVLLSQNTVDILFDKDLFYDEKEKVLVTTSYDRVAMLKIGENKININGDIISTKVSASIDYYNYDEDDRYDDTSIVRNSTNMVYIPIKELESVYNITVDFKDKIIITDNNKDRNRYLVRGDEPIEVKATNDSLSKTLFSINPGDYFDVFGFDDTKEFNYIRNFDGEMGYLSTETINSCEVEASYKKEEVNTNKEKITIAWDYVNENASSIDDKNRRKKIENLDVVAPTLIYLQNTDGTVLYRVNPSTQYMEWAKKEKYDVWVTVKNDLSGIGIKETSEFLNSTKARMNFIDELLGYANRFNVQGINIDFENMYKEDAIVFAQLIRELSAYCHQIGLVCSVCVNIPDGSDTWSLCYDHKALSEAADYLAVMTYDQFGASSKLPGPNASYDWVVENIEKLVDRDRVPSNKILLGIAFYSRLWTKNKGNFSNNAISMSKAIKIPNGMI